MKQHFENKQDQVNFINNTLAGIATALRGVVLRGATLDNDWCGSIESTHAGTFQLWFNYDKYEHRFTVRADWPGNCSQRELLSYDEDKSGKVGDLVLESSIRLTASKTPEQLAKDIFRRLVPTAQLFYCRAVERINRQNKHAEDSRVNSDKVAQAAGTKKSAHHANANRYNVSLPENVGGYGGFEVEGDYVKFEISSLKLDKAVKLANFLKTL